jgi:hypothetical protein
LVPGDFRQGPRNRRVNVSNNRNELNGFVNNADSPSGLQCNSDGLTSLGRYLIQRMPTAEFHLIDVPLPRRVARDGMGDLVIRAVSGRPRISGIGVSN